eukprot:302903-Amorphochlora_amoeboformis.AAC.1
MEKCASEEGKVEGGGQQGDERNIAIATLNRANQIYDIMAEHATPEARRKGLRSRGRAHLDEDGTRPKTPDTKQKHST